MEQVKKIFIIGSKGMAGHVINFYLKENTNYKVLSVARDSQLFAPDYEADVTDFSTLARILETETPDFVINCIGLLNQEAENNPDKAILLNSYLPHFLAKKGEELNYKLIHISTDCVFNGNKGSYAEDSIKDGYGFYAQSKALGEVSYGNNVTIRTSIIGPEIKQNGIGLFHWFMNQIGNIKGYTEAYWTGVTTLELAKAITSLIEQDVEGLYHLVNSEKISKFNLLVLFKDVFHMQTITIEQNSVYKTDKSLTKTNYGFNYDVPDYGTMIAEMRDWIKEHSELYKYKF